MTFDNFHGIRADVQLSTEPSRAGTGNVVPKNK